MYFTPEMQRDLKKKDLEPALKRSGFAKNNFSLIIVDDNIQFLASFCDAILTDSIVSAYVSGIAYHWYSTGKFSRDLINEASEKFSDNFFFSSEACAGWRKGIEPAICICKDIIEGLNRGSQGWVDWNLALDMEGGPNWTNNTVDSPIIVNAEKSKFYKNPMFYI
ncbi:glucosylceramidase-like protein, partial [Dinothrombium tinctorium]